jgi:hypothetical protein
MRTAKQIRRGLPALAFVLAACAATEEPVSPRAAGPSPIVEAFRRDRPVYHVVDPNAPVSYFIYAAEKGPMALTMEPGAGLRAATPAESRIALDRYETLHRVAPQEQHVVYAELLRAERQAGRDYSDELVAMMQGTIQRWEEEKGALQIRLEAARASGAKDKEAQTALIINELDRRILAHEIKIQLYASAEYKAARSDPKAVTVRRAEDAAK